MTVTAHPLVDRLLSTHGLIHVVHAPAGYGKTRLLRNIADALDRAGVKHVDHPTCESHEAGTPWLLLESNDPRDFDSVALQKAASFIAASRAGMVIATRSSDGLPIARLRAEGKVTVTGPRQLMLPKTTSQQLLRPILPRATADRLVDLADGWPVAVQMLVDYARNPDSRFDAVESFLSRSGLSAYIEQEVLATLPEERISALLFASMINGCDRSFLDAVRPDDDLGRHLAHLALEFPGLIEDRAGLVTVNPLLRSYMRSRFDDLARDIRHDALERAAIRCGETSRMAEAIELISRVGKPDAIARLIDRSDGLTIWFTGGYDLVDGIVAAAGSKAFDAHPRLQLFKCLVHLRRKEIAQAESLFRKTAAMLAGDESARRDVEILRIVLRTYGCLMPIEDEPVSIDRAVLRSRTDPLSGMMLATLEGILRTQDGQLDEATAILEEAAALTRLAKADYNLPFLHAHHAAIARARGDLSGAREELGKARKGWREGFSNDLSLTVLLEAISANVDFESGRLSSARASVRQIAPLLPDAELWLDIFVALYEPMARLRQLDDGLAAATSSLHALQDRLTASGRKRVAHILRALELCLKGEAVLRDGEDVGVERPLRPASESLLSWHEREMFDMADAYAEMAVGLYDDATQRLKALVDFAAPRGLRRTQLRASLLLVAALEKQHDTDGADAVFDRALALGADTGLSRVFAEIGGDAVRRRCRARIATLKTTPPTDPRSLRLLRQIARWEQGAPTNEAPRLTQREMDVLAALEQGGSDKTIGRRLGVTEYAVRHHLRNIYRKLSTHDRVSALAQARQKQLIG